ncbi:hypothetical protein AOCH_001732 [Aspergillus ochraceoroseus]|nr:hypothetical protein AOCH_001732 [Aspergillus ochraceoroseus]
MAVLGLCPPLAWAQISSFSPNAKNDIIYSITVPAESASAGTGPILFQIQAPTTYQWVGLGQGSRMAGANIFLLYTAASSQNVTLSPRVGMGHVMPKYNAEDQITLLAGSGVQNGIMTANVRCETCRAAPSSTSSWIFAYKKGSSLNSDSVSEEISIHDSCGVTNVDLSNAISTSANPFLSYGASSKATASSDDSGAGNDMLIAHGFIMGIAFVLLFPSFALANTLPIRNVATRIHAPLQVFTMLLAVAGMGLGIKLGIDNNNINDVHPILGLVVMSILILFQPALGLLQHLHFRQTGGKSPFAYMHRWLGRGMIILGIITGGLGLRLAGIGSPDTPVGAVIAYSVIAGVMALFYVMVQMFQAMQRRGQSTREYNDARKRSASTISMALQEMRHHNTHDPDST